MLHIYTRAQSIAEGKLLDVSDQAYTFGFRVPVAISRAAWSDTVQWDHGGVQDETGRLADVLSMGVASVKALAERNANTCHYTVYRTPNQPDAREAEETHLAIVCTAGGQEEPVVTIMCAFKLTTRLNRQQCEGTSNHGDQEISRTAGHLGTVANKLAEATVILAEQPEHLDREQVGDAQREQLLEAAELLRHASEKLISTQA